jgi:hypothetical protein
MGSKPADQGTMKTASAGAQASDQALADQAKQNTLFANSARTTQFGAGAGSGGNGDVSGGTLGGFLDPSKLNVDHPTGTYGLQYNQFLKNNAKSYQNAQGAATRDQANRGITQTGFAADQSRQLARDQADTEGAGFSDYAGKSYQDALQKFWAANDALSGQGTGAMSAAIAGNQAAAGNYSNLYNSASQPRPSALGQIVGGALGAAGQIGAAALTGGGSTAAQAAQQCPVEGSLILMFDGSEIPVEEIRSGMNLMGIDGDAVPVLQDPISAVALAVEVRSPAGSTRVSESHTFALVRGGYEYALGAEGKPLWHRLYVATCSVEPLGEKKVYPLILGGSHSYAVDGFWSLS